METPKEYYYTYYSYEEWGRGYFGSRKCYCLPEEDVRYFGSSRDKTFRPTQKIILRDDYATREEAYVDEIILQQYYKVAENPHFANRVYQTSINFYYPLTREEAIKNGKKTYELGLGIHKLTSKEKGELGKKNYELGLGIHGLSREKRSENGKKSYQKGLAKLTKEQRNEIAKKTGAIFAEKYSKEFTLISPEGEIVSGKNVSKFCRDSNLNQGAIQKVLKGTRSHHKGWKRYCEITILDFL